jgi:four helix bundle protein
MATIKHFEDIEAWQLARQMCVEIHDITLQGAFGNDFSLKDQIRRSSGSVMDNIAEGFGRDGNREFIQFLSYSKGSASEVQSQLYRALDNKYIDEGTFQKLYDLAKNIIGKTTNFMKYLSNSSLKGPKYQ